jgi:hypothetical protein
VETGTQAAEVLVLELLLELLAAGVELDSLAAGVDEDDDSAPLAAGVSVLGLDDPPELLERLSVL